MIGDRQNKGNVMGRWGSFKEFIWGKKESQTASIIAAPSSDGKILPTRGYDNFAKETYLKNVTAFRCILEIGRSVASVPWGQFRWTDAEEETREKVTDSVTAKTLKRPNPQDGFSFLMLQAASYLAMSGNTFFEKIGPTTGPNKGEPSELYVQRPDRFELKINTHTGQLEKYIYKVDGRSTDWEVDPITGKSDILHLKNFHPLDDWYGAAPTESAAVEIDTSNALSEWNMNLIGNQCRPGMIYTLIGNTGEQFMDQLDTYLRTEKAGVHNVGKNMILTGERGTKAEPYGFNPAEMDFGEGDMRVMRKIAMAYGVPPELLGIQDATYSNRAEARLFFWENTVFYYLDYIKSELNNWLFETDTPTGKQVFIDYILDDVPAMSLKRDKLWERANKSDYMSIAEKREMVGLPKWEENDDPANQIFIEASKLPIGMAAEGEGKEESEEAVVKSLQAQGYDEDDIDLFLGMKSGSED